MTNGYAKSVILPHAHIFFYSILAIQIFLLLKWPTMKFISVCCVLFLLAYSVSASAELDLSDTAVLIEMKDMAEHGYLDAQVILGDWYYNGSEVEKNYSAAARYYELAAKQGHERAQCILGGMYFLGKGVDKDAKKARYWLVLAADKGMKEADVLLASMNGSQKNNRFLQSASVTNNKPVISSLNFMAR